MVIEYPVELGSLPFNIADGRLLGMRNRRYGRTVLAIYACRPTGKRGHELRPEEFMQIGVAPRPVPPVEAEGTRPEEAGEQVQDEDEGSDEE